MSSGKARHVAGICRLPSHTMISSCSLSAKRRRLIMDMSSAVASMAFVTSSLTMSSASSVMAGNSQLRRTVLV